METEDQGSQPLSREGAWSRLIGAVISPLATFEAIARKPSWLLPILLIVLVNVAVAHRQRPGSALTVPNSAVEQRLKSDPTFQRLTRQQQAQELKEARVVAKYVVAGAIYFGVIVGTPLAFLIIAAVLLFAFNVFFGAGIKFKQSFAVTSYASVPYLLSSVVTLVLVWTHPPGAALTHDLSVLSLAGFLSPHVSPWLRALARSVNVFDLWTLGLLAVGYTAASSKRVRFGSALAVVVAIWAVYLLATAALFSRVAHR